MSQVFSDVLGGLVSRGGSSSSGISCHGNNWKVTRFCGGSWSSHGCLAGPGDRGEISGRGIRLRLEGILPERVRLVTKIICVSVLFTISSWEVNRDSNSRRCARPYIPSRHVLDYAKRIYCWAICWPFRDSARGHPLTFALPFVYCAHGLPYRRRLVRYASMYLWCVAKRHNVHNTKFFLRELIRSLYLFIWNIESACG